MHEDDPSAILDAAVSDLEGRIQQHDHHIKQLHDQTSSQDGRFAEQQLQISHLVEAKAKLQEQITTLHALVEDIQAKVTLTHHPIHHDRQPQYLHRRVQRSYLATRSKSKRLFVVSYLIYVYLH